MFLTRLISPSATTSAPAIHKPQGFLPEHLARQAAEAARARGDEKAATDFEHLMKLSQGRKIELRLVQGGGIQPRNLRKPGTDPVVTLGGYEPGKDSTKAETFVYDAGEKQSLPGSIVIRDWEDPSQNPDAKAAKFFRDIHDGGIGFMREKLHLNSMDDKGRDVHGTRRYGRKYNNAFWDGTQFVAGLGDEVYFTDFSQDEDVTIHEISHGITEFMAGSKRKAIAQGLSPELAKLMDNPLVASAVTAALLKKYGDDPVVAVFRDKEENDYYLLKSGLLVGGLDYYGDPGSTNEHYSDVFAVWSRIATSGKKVKDMTYDDWLLGAKCMVGVNDGPGGNGKKAAIRNFGPEPGYNRKGLGKDPQPKHVKDKYTGPGDSGGVHYNSGYKNLAFRLAAEKLAESNPDETLDTVGSVWFAAELVMHNKESDKEYVADVLMLAKEMFPSRPDVAQAVEYAFTQVGLMNQGLIGGLYNKVRSRIVWLPKWVDYLKDKVRAGQSRAVQGGDRIVN